MVAHVCLQHSPTPLTLLLQVLQLPGCADLDCDLQQFLDLLSPRADPKLMEQLCGSSS